MALKILSATNPMLLEQEAEKYDITQLGSISIANGHFFIAFLGELKEVPKVLKEPEPEVKSEEVPAKPKTTRKRKPRAKPKVDG